MAMPPRIIGSESHCPMESREPPQQREERYALERELVELRRVARIGPGAAEHHAPRHIGYAPPQLAVDEVAEPPRGEPDRHQRRDEVHQREKAALLLAPDEPRCRERPEEPAVERHPALPDGEDFERVRRVVPGLVEKHVAEPSPQDHAENAVEKQIVDELHRRAPPGIALRPHPAEKEKGGEADEVHKPVPTHGEGADLEGDGVDRGMDQHGGAAVRYRSGGATRGRCPLVFVAAAYQRTARGPIWRAMGSMAG